MYLKNSVLSKEYVCEHCRTPLRRWTDGGEPPDFPYETTYWHCPNFSCPHHEESVGGFDFGEPDYAISDPLSERKVFPTIWHIWARYPDTRLCESKDCMLVRVEFRDGNHKEFQRINQLWQQVVSRKKTPRVLAGFNAKDWHTYDGRRIAIHHMEDEHLVNTMHMLKKQAMVREAATIVDMLNYAKNAPDGAAMAAEAGANEDRDWRNSVKSKTFTAMLDQARKRKLDIAEFEDPESEKINFLAARLMLQDLRRKRNGAA